MGDVHRLDLEARERDERPDDQRDARQPAHRRREVADAANGIWFGWSPTSQANMNTISAPRG